MRRWGGVLLGFMIIVSACRTVGDSPVETMEVEMNTGTPPTARATTSTPSPTELPVPLTPVVSSTPITGTTPTATPVQSPATPRATAAAPFPWATSSPVQTITLTILYDNNPGEVGLPTGWGFACLVEGLPETILFDTGADGALLMRNMAALDVAPEEIDAIVLSHAHGDHTGGLAAVLAVAPDARVYLLPNFPVDLKRRIQDAGAELVEVQEPMLICPGARVTGRVGGMLPEQALVLDGPAGLVVITGCAHPGVVAMVHAARVAAGVDDALPRCACSQVDLLLGGFHLGEASATQIDAIAAELQKLDVQRVAPCHCSGSRARSLFELAYGDAYVPVGVGTRLTLAPPYGVPSGIR